MTRHHSLLRNPFAIIGLGAAAVWSAAYLSRRSHATAQPPRSYGSYDKTPIATAEPAGSPHAPLKPWLAPPLPAIRTLPAPELSQPDGTTAGTPPTMSHADTFFKGPPSN